MTKCSRDDCENPATMVYCMAPHKDPRGFYCQGVTSIFVCKEHDTEEERRTMGPLGVFFEAMSRGQAIEELARMSRLVEDMEREEVAW